MRHPRLTMLADDEMRTLETTIRSPLHQGRGLANAKAPSYAHTTLHAHECRVMAGQLTFLGKSASRSPSDEKLTTSLFRSPKLEPTISRRLNNVKNEFCQDANSAHSVGD